MTLTMTMAMAMTTTTRMRTKTMMVTMVRMVKIVIMLMWSHTGDKNTMVVTMVMTSFHLILINLLHKNNDANAKLNPDSR